MKAKYLGALVLPLVISGCSWFGGDEEEVRVPNPLLPVSQEVQLDRLWNTSVGRGAEDKTIKLVPGFEGTRVFAASADGTVKALESGSGREIWQVDIRDFYNDEERRNAFSDTADTITGGVGVGEQLVLVGSSAGEVVAMNQSDGSLAWRGKATSEVLAPPQIDGGLVVAQTIDGKVAAFNALDGERRWLYSTSIPSLTLRGTATPHLSDAAITGFGNGRVIVLDRERGLPVMDQRIAASKGQSDLERLVDIDGLIERDGNTLYAASYQGNVVAMDLSQGGRVRWGKPASTVTGVSVGFGNVYLSNADGEVFAFDTSNGDENWQNTDLLYRDLSTPVPLGSYLIVGDFEGYLHLLAQSDGRFVGRTRVDGDGVSSPAIVDGSRVYVQDNSGRLTAFQLQ